MNRLGRIILALLVATAAVVVFHSTTRSAQSTMLSERVTRLRAEVGRVPTTAENFRERVLTLMDWAGELIVRGRFVPQMAQTSFTRLITPGFTQNTHRGIVEWTKILGFIEDQAGKSGTFVRTDRQELVAAEYATVVLEYTAGEVEARAGSVFRIGHHFMSDGARIQIDNPRGDSFVSFKTSNPNVMLEPMTSPWLSAYAGFRGPEAMPAVKVNSGTLARGDKLIITLGDTSQGGRGYRVQTREADDLRYPLEADLDGSGVFVPLGAVSTRVKGSRAALINAVVPSVVAAGESFALRLRVEDTFFNPADFAGGSFKVRFNGREVGSINVAAGQSVGRIDGLKFDREGAYRLEVTSSDGKFSCISNPVLVERNPQQRIYWGELHGHGGWEEGTGSVAHYYEYARDIAFLDFGSLTGHDAMLLKPAWDEIRRETERANRAGQFVAYMGYEWTVPLERGGHHNVFFKNDRGRYATLFDAPRLPLLYEKLKSIDAVDNILVIPHAHQTGDWNYTDAEVEHLVEIYSMHGSFEYFGQRYLRRGYRTGFIAASDNHTGHPGYSPAQTSVRGGLAGVYAARLERDGIWEGMKGRATYATTSNQRIVVKMTVGDRPVGQAVRTGTTPVIRARALGTAAIAHIDVIHNGEVAYRKDYLLPMTGKPTGVQIMFHSSTETQGDQHTFPQNGVTWRGWIEVTGGRIGSIEKLGADHFTDQFNQVDDRRVWFVCKTRGDFDGVLLKLTEAPADTHISVRITQIERDPGPQGGRLPRGATEPAKTALHEYRFKVDEVARQKGQFEVPQFGFVYARKVNAESRWDASFSFRPAKAPAQDDYYYLRVVQIDGEVAWVSPVWIGEQASPKKR